MEEYTISQYSYFLHTLARWDSFIAHGALPETNIRRRIYSVLEEERYGIRRAFVFG